MKNIVTVVLIAISTFSMAQNKGVQEVKIQTSAQCSDCEERIEQALIYTKGVKYAELDLATKIVTVGYTAKKIDPAKIKEVIANTGYDADDVKAKNEAVEALPACCKPNGMKH